MAKMKVFLIFAALFIGQSTSQERKIIPAPLFGEGENLSFENCGKWNKSGPRIAPWTAQLYFDSDLVWHYGSIISRTTIIILSDSVKLDDEKHRKFLKNGLARAQIGRCRRETNCTLDMNQGAVVKVLDVVKAEDIPGIYLFTTEKMPEFNAYYFSICLFNRGNQLDFEEQSENSRFEIWSKAFYLSREVHLEPIERCLNNKTMTELKNQEPRKLEALLCFYIPDYWTSSLLLHYHDGRYFLRGSRVRMYDESHGFNTTTHHLFYDFLALTQWIGQQSPDISVLQQIPASNRHF